MNQYKESSLLDVFKFETKKERNRFILSLVSGAGIVYLFFVLMFIVF